jgi:hypothetical protein
VPLATYSWTMSWPKCFTAPLRLKPSMSPGKIVLPTGLQTVYQSRISTSNLLGWGSVATNYNIVAWTALPALPSFGR